MKEYGVITRPRYTEHRRMAVFRWRTNGVGNDDATRLFGKRVIVAGANDDTFCASGRRAAGKTRARLESRTVPDRCEYKIIWSKRRRAATCGKIINLLPRVHCASCQRLRRFILDHALSPSRQIGDKQSYRRMVLRKNTYVRTRMVYYVRAI